MLRSRDRLRRGDAAARAADRAAVPPGATAAAPVWSTASPLLPPAAAAPADRADLDETVPRGAMREFLSLARRGDYEGAARHLDLSAVPAEELAERGPRLARELHIVLDRTLWVDLDALSDQPEGLEDDGLPPGRDRLGTIRARGGAVDLLLARVPAAGGGMVWRVSASTVERIPELYAQHGYPPFVERLPREFVDWGFLGTDLWQWIGLLALAPAAWASRVPRGLGDPAPRALLRAPHGDRARRPDRRVRPPPAAAHGDALPLPRRHLLAAPRRARPGLPRQRLPRPHHPARHLGRACGS